MRQTWRTVDCRNALPLHHSLQVLDVDVTDTQMSDFDKMRKRILRRKVLLQDQKYQ